MLEYVAGWGVVAVGFGLTGLLAACRTSAPWRIVAAAWGLSLVSVLTMAENDAWVCRFILFFPALLSIGAANLVIEMRSLLLPLLLLCGVTIAGTFFTEDVSVTAIVQASRMSWRERTFAAEMIPEAPYPRIGCYGDLASMSYLLYRPDLSREVVYPRPSSPSDLADTMERLQLPALYALSVRDRDGWGALLQECIRSGRLKQVRGPWYELVRR
jgi:hypothetical protein